MTKHNQNSFTTSNNTLQQHSVQKKQTNERRRNIINEKRIK